MNFSQSKDERLLAFYENVRSKSSWIRRRADAIGSLVKAQKRYAEHLREELDRRRLNYHPIDW
jgi:hypothetical protein